MLDRQVLTLTQKSPENRGTDGWKAALMTVSKVEDQGPSVLERDRKSHWIGYLLLLKTYPNI